MKFLRNKGNAPLLPSEIFKYYTCPDFFHKIINKLLRKTINPT